MEPTLNELPQSSSTTEVNPLLTLNTTPENIGGDGKILELKSFQEPEIRKGVARGRMGIAWDPGLGKTCGAATIATQRRARKWLIICPDNALSMWGGNPKYPDLTAIDWIKRWHSGATVKVELINGTPAEREKQWEAPWDLRYDYHLRIVTLETFTRDWKISSPGSKRKAVKFAPKKRHPTPDIVILDEAKKIRNKASQGTQILSSYMRHYSVPNFLPLTGTPGHEPKHFFTMLHILDPRYFSSYWRFVDTFHMVDDGPFGKEINEPRNLDEWYKVLDRYFSILKEDDPEVSQHRPIMSRQLLDIELDATQKTLYRELTKEMMVWLEQDDKLVVAQNEFTVLTRLRQLLVCPQIFGPNQSPGAAIVDFCEREDPDQCLVIFTPFKAAFPFFRDYLVKHGFDRVFEFSGGMGTEERDRLLSLYRGQRGVALCTIQYAQAFSFEPATRAYFIGYDWDPDNNVQAEKRLQRLTQPLPCMAYYYTFRSTFDATLCAAVNLKQQRMNITVPSNIRQMFST